MKLPAHQSGLQLPSLFPRRHFLIHWSQSQFSFTPPFPPFLLFPPFLTHSLPLSSSPVFHCLARPLFRGSGSAGHWCAMSFSERSQEFSASAEPPLSFSTRSPLFPLPQLLSLALFHCLSPGLLQPPHITWVLEIDSLPKEWELEQMEYEWFTRVWKRCLGEGSGVGGPSIAS